jgi:hypothetical protein
MINSPDILILNSHRRLLTAEGCVDASVVPLHTHHVPAIRRKLTMGHAVQVRYSHTRARYPDTASSTEAIRPVGLALLGQA